MVLDPPRKQVNVKRMIIYSFIPILALYAAWRIQKFWVLLGINFALNILFTLAGGAIGAVAESTSPEYATGVIVAGIVVSIVINVAISISLVRSFARKYNEKIATSSTPQPSNLPPP